MLPSLAACRPPIASLVLVLVLGGCTRGVSTLPGLLGPAADPPAMVLATGAEGEDCGASILLVPWRRATLERAVERALDSVPHATLLTDARVEWRTLTTGVYNRSCVRVRGTAARLVSRLVVPATEGHHEHPPGQH